MNIRYNFELLASYAIGYKELVVCNVKVLFNELYKCLDDFITARDMKYFCYHTNFSANPLNIAHSYS